MYSKKIQRVSVPSWTINKGYFALIDPCSPHKEWECYDWYSCREEFTAESKNIRRMCFASGFATPKDVSDFMNRIERMLKLETKSIFGRTQRTNPTSQIIWIRPSPWWMNTFMKRSLFTALLRAASNYSSEKRNFKEALFSIDYLRDTKYATERFLKGYTKYKGRGKGSYYYGGWWDKFYWGHGDMDGDDPVPLSPEEIDKILVKP